VYKKLTDSEQFSNSDSKIINDLATPHSASLKMFLFATASILVGIVAMIPSSMAIATPVESTVFRAERFARLKAIAPQLKRADRDLNLGGNCLLPASDDAARKLEDFVLSKRGKSIYDGNPQRYMDQETHSTHWENVVVSRSPSLIVRPKQNDGGVVE
jgi:hypothetical protein